MDRLSFQTIKISVLFILFSYTAVGIFLAINAPNKDPYPFSSWSLYHLVPNTLTEYLLRITEENGKKYDPPVPFQEADQYDMLIETISLTAYWKLIQRLGDSLEHGREDDIQRYHSQIERNFRSREIRYEVLKISYDVLEYSRSKRFNVIKHLGPFSP